MSSTSAIQATAVGKRYRIGVRARYRSLRDVIMSIATRPFRGGSEEGGTFWALSDVSFHVRHGDVIGLIGRNGAGKSTLLKILSRITEPTTGEIAITGRIGSLLEVGTGFHPELTGRENIFLNGAILGMRRAEIARKFDEIVNFSEVERFLDTPVRHYSSGMYMRLAFAVAAHLEPEILIVDEVLAVGDAAFQRKCLGKMGDVAKQRRTVLFVSHNMSAINRLCQSVIWLDAGRIVESGPTASVVAQYLSANSSHEGSFEWPEGTANPGVDEFKLLAMRIQGHTGGVTSVVDARYPFYVSFDYRIEKPLPQCRIGFVVATADGTSVFEGYDSDNAHDHNTPGLHGARVPGTFRIRCEIPGELLLPGRYILSFNAGMPGIKNLLYVENLLTFTVEQTRTMSEVSVTPEGMIKPKLKWEILSQS
jgi:lipopolysaccharide transport system ATP-binding protein